MSDKNVRNEEDMLEVLADDIERYELLLAKETENILHEVESRHSELPIEIDQDHGSDITNSQAITPPFVHKSYSQ